jgi:hypothetical protein
MILAALTIGAGAPEGNFAGCVAEVYAQACLCALANGGLMTLGTSKLGSLPCGVMIGAPRDFSFHQTLAAGAALAARGGVLRVGGAGLAVDLRQARPWRCCLADLRLDLRSAPTRRAWRAAWRVLRRDGRQAGLRRIAGATMDALSLATRRYDGESAYGAMRGLVGLGEGLTPSGDDYLVGYFAGLWACAGQASAEASFATALAGRLKTLSGWTNPVSRLYLEAAAGGQVSERLYNVASCISAGRDQAAVSEAVGAALAVGHSSGASGVLGLLRGCAVWADATEADLADSGEIFGADRRG